MRLSRLTTLLLAAFTFSVAAHADTIAFASAAGTTSYTYGYGFGSQTGTGGTAVATTVGYSNPVAGSQWVSTSANGGNGTVGVTVYTNTVNLLANENYSGTISFMADDYAGVLVDGVEVYAINGSTGYYSPTTINLLPSYFRSGANTISVEVYNTGGPAAADYAGTLTGTAAVTPEPSSLALLGTGLLCSLGVAGRRFRRA